MRFYYLEFVFYLCFVRGSHWEVFVKYLFVQIKQIPWKIPAKVFVVTKVAGCRSLALLKLTLSQICFKELCKNVYLAFEEMVHKYADPKWTSGIRLQYQSGVYKGENLYKGIVAFMVVRLKQFIPSVVQANPEVTFNGQWLAEKISGNIDSLIEIWLSIRGIVTVSTSIRLLPIRFQHWKIFNSESNCCIKHPKNSSKTYLFYGTVHLMKYTEICNFLFSSLYLVVWSIQHLWQGTET